MDEWHSKVQHDERVHFFSTLQARLNHAESFESVCGKVALELILIEHPLQCELLKDIVFHDQNFRQRLVHIYNPILVL